MKFNAESTVDIIEVISVSLPATSGKELFRKAESYIAPHVKTGQSLADLINRLHDHHVRFERAFETEDNSALPQELQFRNYWYQFGDKIQEVALLQCIVRTCSVRELH